TWPTRIRASGFRALGAGGGGRRSLHTAQRCDLSACIAYPRRLAMRGRAADAVAKVLNSFGQLVGSWANQVCEQDLLAGGKQPFKLSNRRENRLPCRPMRKEEAELHPVQMRDVRLIFLIDRRNADKQPIDMAGVIAAHMRYTAPSDFQRQQHCLR